MSQVPPFPPGMTAGREGHAHRADSPADGTLRTRGEGRGRHREPSRSRTGRVVRATLGVVGELCLTAGAIVALFLVWELGYVSLVEGRRQAAEVERLEAQFRSEIAAPGADTPGSGTTPGSVATPGPSAPSEPAGQAGAGAGDTAGDTATAPSDLGATAILRIPRLGEAWAKPVRDGVGSDVLAQGIGHYPGTVQPGRVGNVALAGHRSGHGNPLIDIDTVRVGDRIVLETRDGWFVYRTDRSEIVSPDRTEVLAPVPGRPGVRPTERWLTLTTCHPRFGNSHRYVVFAELERSFTRAEGPPPSWLAAPEGS